MRFIFLLLILFTFVSCSSSRLERKIEDKSWDSLADESYLRWGSDRLRTDSSKQEIVGCYKGEVKETLDSYKRKFQSLGQHPYYWIHIGNCYFLIDEWSKAEFFYRMAVENPKTSLAKSAALNNLALISFRYEQWEKGREFLRQSIQAAPSSKVPLYNLSQLYLQFGFFERAIQVLTSPLLRSSKDIDFYFSLANAHLYKGDLTRAEGYFQSIPKEFLDREDIAATYALYLLRKGKLHEASEVIKNRNRSGVPELTAISHKLERIIAERMKQEE